MTATPEIKPTAAEAIRILSEKHSGEITPEIVLKAAKSKNSPLHPYFDWNDTKAAEKFRLIQAQYLIRRIKVTYETRENKSVRVRAYVNVRADLTETEEPEARGIYVPIERAMSVNSYRDQLLNQCRRDMGAFRQKYSSLTEVQGVLSAMEAVA